MIVDGIRCTYIVCLQNLRPHEVTYSHTLFVFNFFFSLKKDAH